MDSRLLTDPPSFFRERVDNPGILIPTLIVIATGVIAAVGSAPVADLTSQLATEGLASQGQQLNESTVNAVGTFTSVFSTIFSFLSVLLGWIVYSIAFYLIARFAFGGSASLGNTFAFTGWGYIPMLIHQLISAAAAYYVYSGVTLPNATVAAQTTLQELQNDPVILAAGVIGLVLLVWSGVIWTAAMSQLHDVSRRNAIITVGIPVGIAFLRRASGLL
ncbi:Yip1 family protein [Halocatena pleomorpha]|nr:Yip1 family protein [Halocatena pleomorpha]